jgi:hypothetical protein
VSRGAAPGEGAKGEGRGRGKGAVCAVAHSPVIKTIATTTISSFTALFIQKYLVSPKGTYPIGDAFAQLAIIPVLQAHQNERAQHLRRGEAAATSPCADDRRDAIGPRAARANRLLGLSHSPDR